MHTQRIARLEYRRALYQETMTDLALAVRRIEAELAALRRAEHEARLARADRAEARQWYGKQVSDTEKEQAA